MSQRGLQIRQHQLYVRRICLMDRGCFGEIALTARRLALQEMAFVRFTAHDFATSAATKPLSSSATRF